MADDEQTRDDEATTDERTRADATGGPAAEGGPAHGPVRYTRRRVLVLGGAFAAGVVAVIAGLRALGGPSEVAEKVGGPVADQFGTFPVRSVEDVPDVPPGRVGRQGRRPGRDAAHRRPGHLGAACSAAPRSWTSTAWRAGAWTTCSWGGVAPSVLFDQAGVKPEAKYAVLHAYGGVYMSSLPLELMRDGQTLLADQLGGQPLPPEHGGPLRLVVPKQLGYKNVKWVERIELAAESKRGYWESNGYTDDAPVPGG